MVAREFFSPKMTGIIFIFCLGKAEKDTIIAFTHSV
jgi:hypothetical protein